VGAILLSLLASMCWGTADFTGGLVTRRASVIAVLFMVEAVGLALVLAAVVITREPVPDGEAILLSLAAGVSGVTALGLFYSALSIGTMSIVAPISASGAALPVVVGLATGDTLTTLAAAGLAVTMVGVILASLEAVEEEEVHQHTRRARLSVALALGAALGFGGYFAISDPAADASVLWLLVFVRIVAVPVLLALLVIRGIRIPGGRDRALLTGAGALDVTATGLYGVANTLGALSIVAVAGSLYPVTTVLLARGVLGERLRPVQGVGVALALAGVVLLAAG
jgi:drug/metabolite transporter (DMT)-like permease